jgi:aerobic-type carbon monoxide dehydrogenase small subunit (CoxS/CutS family)
VSVRTAITIRVNGIAETHEVESHRTLLEFLREDLNLTGTKEGCNEGECGACMVLLGGRAVNSCLVLAVEADGKDVTTIEGLADGAHLHPLQRAFLAHSAVQCGYCTPGMIVTAFALLKEHPDPTEADVRRALSGCMCRCTGYRQIIDAVLDAAQAMRAEGAAREAAR